MIRYLIPGCSPHNAHLELPAGEAHRGGCGKENFTPARTGEAATGASRTIEILPQTTHERRREILARAFALLLSVQK